MALFFSFLFHNVHWGGGGGDNDTQKLWVVTDMIPITVCIVFFPIIKDSKDKNVFCFYNWIVLFFLLQPILILKLFSVLFYGSVLSVIVTLMPSLWWGIIGMVKWQKGDHYEACN